MKAAKRQKKEITLEDLIRDLIIITLAKEGIPQVEIRDIVGGDIYRVNRIAKYFKGKKGKV
jgi:hypothetical protein